jgi:hypothetical protein
MIKSYKNVGIRKSEEFNLKFNDFRPSPCLPSPLLKLKINNFKQTLIIPIIPASQFLSTQERWHP